MARSLLIVNDPTWTYQMRCEHGGLLYVGIARNFERRMKQHRASKPWWHEVADVIAHQYPTRAEARRMELDIILYRQPQYNVEGVDEYKQYHADPLCGRTLGRPFKRLEFGSV